MVAGRPARRSGLTPRRIDPVLVIDESLPKRVAAELKARGRDAVTVAHLRLRGSKDPDLLDALHERYPQPGRFVLVTADDNLPLDHAAGIARVGITVATIDPHRPDGITPDAWRREVVHRWAHAMVDQTAGSIVRYSVARARAWSRRRR